MLPSRSCGLGRSVVVILIVVIIPVLLYSLVDEPATGVPIELQDWIDISPPQEDVNRLAGRSVCSSRRDGVKESQLRRFSFFLLVNRLGSLLNVKNPTQCSKCFDGHEGAGLDWFRNLVVGVLARKGGGNHAIQ